MMTMTARQYAVATYPTETHASLKVPCLVVVVVAASSPASPMVAIAARWWTIVAALMHPNLQLLEP